MNVKVVAITQSLLNELTLTAEELIIYIARVSNPGNQANTETAPKLMRHCIKNKHWSVFDMANLTVEVVTSKVVSIQILRHWSIKPQEFSQRYAEVVDIEPIELRKQGNTNRQGGEEVFNPAIKYIDDWTSTVYEGYANSLVESHITTTKNLYKALIEAKVAKESARMVLPMASQTRMYLNGSVRSWIHYLEQRCDLHAQKEHLKKSKRYLPTIFQTYQKQFMDDLIDSPDLGKDPKLKTFAGAISSFARKAGVYIDLSPKIYMATIENKKESINHPQHYGGDTTYEAIKVIKAWDLGFELGNSVKYICRAGKKDPARKG